MKDVFISYSRVDFTFARQLAQSLEEQSLTAWMDVEGLYVGEEIWPEVARAIDGSSAFVYVVTPSSATSDYCKMELEHAVTSGKRIVPVIREAVPSTALADPLREHLWVSLEGAVDWKTALDPLLSAIRADWMELREQARVLIRAREWLDKGRGSSLTLRGKDLRTAEAWYRRTEGSAYGPIPLHREYLLASREAERRRRRRIGGAALIATMALGATSFFGLTQYISSLQGWATQDLKAGRIDAATAQFQRAGEICRLLRWAPSGCLGVRMDLARVLLAVSRFDEARAEMTEIIEQNSALPETDPETANLLGTAHQNRSYVLVRLAEESVDDTVRARRYMDAETDLDAAAEYFDQTPKKASARLLQVQRTRIALGRRKLPEARNQLELAERLCTSEDCDSRADIRLLHTILSRCEGDVGASLLHFQKYLSSLTERLDSPEWKYEQPYFEGMVHRCAEPS